MSFTFKQVKEIVAPYAGRAGRCPSSDEVSVFARQVMQHLLFSGSTSAIKKLDVQVFKGCLVLPPEVETPLKVKINNRNAEVWGKWFSFHSQGHEGYWENCPVATDILIEDGSYSPLVYPLPSYGGIVGVMATCQEEEGSTVTILCKDPTGRQIYTNYRGEKVAGIKLSLVKDEVKYSPVVIGEITGVIKPQTNGYVVLHSLNQETLEVEKFLADWSPSEERPSYRKYKLLARECGDVVNVSILCRIKLKDNYLDNELTVFDNSLALLLAAQRLQSEVNDDVSLANYKRQAVEDVLEKEAGYKKISGNPVSVFYGLSGGRIKNIVMRRR